MRRIKDDRFIIRELNEGRLKRQDGGVGNSGYSDTEVRRALAHTYRLPLNAIDSMIREAESIPPEVGRKT
ncbi:MAG: hypothetical protein JO004_01110 [Methylobacteriaceae bacterium]|nr:hypothetical protein [Methylobacteriaceae bacterium]